MSSISRLIPRTVTGVEREAPALGAPPVAGLIAAIGVVAGAYAVTQGAYAQTVIGLGASYLVAALGYNIVLGLAGQFAFCQNAFMAIGAYGYAVAQPRWGMIPALVVSTLAAGVAGGILGGAVLRTKDIYLALITLAFSEALLLIVQLWPATHGDDGIGVELTTSSAYLVAVVVGAVAMVCTHRLIRSPVGRAFQLVRTDERLASAMGVNVPWTRVLAFSIGGFLGGIGGVLLAGNLTYVTPTNFTLSLTLLLLTMVVVGGAGSLWGTLVGVAVLVAVQQVVPSIGSTGQYVNAGILFAILVLRPGGLRSLVNLRARERAKA
ncbi:MAG TPA: branched-chain amino acid ABC transporter permease [Thermoleophilaceae bacterium]|jgi:branched-chain amino acid transport system permease protein|nr:branched-chain amino acid ABC transporter permease [Thermoleophilaceae bacterium]